MRQKPISSIPQNKGKVLDSDERREVLYRPIAFRTLEDYKFRRLSLNKMLKLYEIFPKCPMRIRL